MDTREWNYQYRTGLSIFPMWRLGDGETWSGFGFDISDFIGEIWKFGNGEGIGSV